MRFSTILEALALAALGLAQNSSPSILPVASSISSSSPTQCAPGKSIGFSFGAEKVTTTLSEVQFRTTGHGRPQQFANCDFEVELGSWNAGYRFAVIGATLRGHANLTSGVIINEFNSTAVFRLQHLKNLSPITPPEIRNLSMSTMLSQVDHPEIGEGREGGFEGDFEVPGSPPVQEVWSPCFEGSEGSGQDSTYLVFHVSATSSGPGELTSGLTIDWDIEWQQCTQNWSEMYGWGHDRIDDWQSCTTRSG